MSVFRLAKDRAELEVHVKRNIAFSEEGSELYRRVPLVFKDADYESGWVEFYHTVGEFEKNRYGNMHGGAIMQVLDTSMGLAAYELGTGNASPTMDIQVNFIKGAKIGDELVVKAEVISTSKHSAVLRAQLSRDGEILAIATSTYRLYTTTVPDRKIFDTLKSFEPAEERTPEKAE